MAKRYSAASGEVAFGAGIFFMQLKRMFFRKEFAIAFSVVSVFILFSFIFEVCFRYGGCEAAESLTPVFGWALWIDADGTLLVTALLYFLVFICAASAFADVIGSDYSDGTMAMQLARCSKREYVLSSLLVSALGGFIVVFIPLAFAQALALIAFPSTSMLEGFCGTVNGSIADGIYLSVLNGALLFPELFYSHPLAYNMAFCLYDSLWGALFAAASLCVSLVITRKKIVVLGLPTLVYILSRFLLPVHVALGEYLYPQSTPVELQAMYFFLLPAVILICEIIFVVICIVKRDLAI